MDLINKASLQTTYTDPDTSEDVTETKESNEVATTDLTASITKEETSSKANIKHGEEIEITNTLKNNTELTLSAITFKGVLSEGGEFVAGSVEVNGEAKAEDDPAAGFAVADMEPAADLLITYRIKLTDGSAVATLTSHGELAYTASEQTFTENTTQVELAVINNNVTVVKAADRTVVVKGGTIHYTVTITNEGTYDNKALSFTDTIPVGTTFVAGSVKINDVEDAEKDPVAGFALADLAATASTKVEFDVTVN